MKDFLESPSYTAGRMGGDGGVRRKRVCKGAILVGILYQAADPLYWAIWLFILFALMAFNELGRTSLWAGIALFAVGLSF